MHDRLIPRRISMSGFCPENRARAAANCSSALSRGAYWALMWR
jgi:hypothetical protein